jgi:hypothetical protein
MVFGRKGKLQVDLGDLTEQQQRLAEFLHSSLKMEVTFAWDKLTVNSETVLPQELQRLVTKYIYKRNLNNTHFAALNGSMVKISRFKEEKTHEKRSKNPVSPKFAHGF